jgi:hypothetical protein
LARGLRDGKMKTNGGADAGWLPHVSEIKQLMERSREATSLCACESD